MWQTGRDLCTVHFSILSAKSRTCLTQETHKLLEINVLMNGRQPARLIHIVSGYVEEGKQETSCWAAKKMTVQSICTLLFSLSHTQMPLGFWKSRCIGRSWQVRGSSFLQVGATWLSVFIGVSLNSTVRLLPWAPPVWCGPGTWVSEKWLNAS